MSTQSGLLPERLARIDEHLKTRYLDSGKIAGAVTLVYRRDELAYFSPVGLMDIERGVPMAEDTVFRIYSMSKPITSVALMMLYEHGHFQLTDPVHRWIPSWRNLGVFEAGNDPHFMTRPCDRPMTIRDLLSHQSGLTYGFMERTNVDAAYRKRDIGNRFDRDLAATMQELASLPLEFSPGTAWNYSVSTDVVGHLVELISGERYDEYLRRHIFEPLGMADTGFVVPEDKLGRFAACYERNRKKELRLQDDPQQSPYAQDPKFHSGGGGLVSTASDYLQFCRMLLNGGELDGARLLGPKTIELMTQNHIEDGRDISSVSAGGFSETTYDGIGFGLGFSVMLDTSRAQLIGTPGEFAWGGAASTAFWIDPVEELIVIFMTQFMPSGTFNFRGQLKSIIYPAIVD